jgi:hypothetical protein
MNRRVKLRANKLQEELHMKAIRYFSPTGYAVVNNNIDNPIPIEFGEGRQELIEEILNDAEEVHIVYNNPFDVYNDTTDFVMSSATQSQSVNDLYDYYPDLQDVNIAAITQHNTQKSLLQVDYPRLGLMRGDGDYGFIDSGSLPSGSYSSDTITSATSVSWAKTGDYSGIASNHCGAVAVTNLALYFAQRGYSDLKINGDKDDTFEAVHDIVGNGPVMTIADEAEEYFDDCGYNLSYSNVGTTSAYKTAINDDRPVGILLAEGIVSWHWIIGIGYRDYTNDGVYFRIVDGWNNTTNKYYKPYSGSLWISATKYWIS